MIVHGVIAQDKGASDPTTNDLARTRRLPRKEPHGTRGRGGLSHSLPRLHWRSNQEMRSLLPRPPPFRKAYPLLIFGNVLIQTWTWLCSEVEAIYLWSSFSAIEGARMLFHTPPEVNYSAATVPGGPRVGQRKNPVVLSK